MVCKSCTSLFPVSWATKQLWNRNGTGLLRKWTNWVVSSSTLPLSRQADRPRRLAGGRGPSTSRPPAVVVVGFPNSTQPEKLPSVGRARERHVPSRPPSSGPTQPSQPGSHTLLFSSRASERALHTLLTCLVSSTRLPSPLISLLPPPPPTSQTHTGRPVSHPTPHLPSPPLDRVGALGSTNAGRGRRRRRTHGRAAARGRAARPPPPGLLLGVVVLELELFGLGLGLGVVRLQEQLQQQQAAGAGRRPAARRPAGTWAAGGPGPGGGPPPGRGAGGGGRVRDPRGPELRAAAPARHGRPLRLHALGGLPRLAVAPRPHHPGRHQRPQEAAQDPRRHPRRRRRLLLLLRAAAAAARAQVTRRDQNRRAHRGAEEAGEGFVPGPALQRGVDPAGAGRARVRGRRAQHVDPHRQALPGAAPLRRGGHHRAVGGGGGARAGDAEGGRERQEPAHRAQRTQRPALCLADPHRARDRREGLRVHHLAMIGRRPELL